MRVLKFWYKSHSKVIRPRWGAWIDLGRWSGLTVQWGYREFRVGSVQTGRDPNKFSVTWPPPPSFT